MEGFCRGGMSCCRLRVLVFHALFWGFISLRVFGAALLGEDRTSAAVAPCWQLEEFTVIQECDRCSDFHLKSQSACRLTGYVERVNCSTTHRDDYRRYTLHTHYTQRRLQEVHTTHTLHTETTTGGTHYTHTTHTLHTETTTGVFHYTYCLATELKFPSPSRFFVWYQSSSRMTGRCPGAGLL
ncbi:protein JTB [Gouania willdenowi]|uniref:protein JTB n=1 Tax=Gouania willdenowi TaxID=441366 RepID=UPI001054BF1F|nr:protein JTB [Gouania willdenowi]